MKFELTLSALGRRLCTVGTTLFFAAILAACANSVGHNAQAQLSPEDRAIQYKFRGIQGGVVYIDASGEKKNNITIYNENGKIWKVLRGIFTAASQSTYPEILYLPKSIHVIWRSNDATEKKRFTETTCNRLVSGETLCTNPCRTGCPDYSRLGFEGGTVLGDYTVPLATRIPDEVLDYIRANGGALRVKIRLKDNGVAIGWDVEKRVPIPNLLPNHVGAKNAIQYVMAGGDFRERRYSKALGEDPGWER